MSEALEMANTIQNSVANKLAVYNPEKRKRIQRSPANANNTDKVSTVEAASSRGLLKILPKRLSPVSVSKVQNNP